LQVLFVVVVDGLSEQPPFCRAVTLLQGSYSSKDRCSFIAADAEVAASLASQKKHTTTTKHKAANEAAAAEEAASLASQHKHTTTTRHKTVEEAAAAGEAALLAS
jgi:hypothetical protein